MGMLRASLSIIWFIVLLPFIKGFLRDRTELFCCCDFLCEKAGKFEYRESQPDQTMDTSWMMGDIWVVTVIFLSTADSIDDLYE